MPKFLVTIERQEIEVEAANEDQAIEDTRDQVEIFADLIDDDKDEEKDEEEKEEIE